VIAVTLGALALAGCGSEAEPAATVTVTETATPSPAPGEPTELVAAPDDPWAPWAKGGPPPTDVGDVDLTGFTSPSGDVACLLSGGQEAQVRCDLRDGPPPAQPKPADCPGDWGDAVVLNATGGGSLLCVSDTVFGQEGETDGSRVLPYGDSVRYRGLTCSVRETGVQCLNAAARGFVASRIAIVTR
jgi:hypothetical protein